MQKNKKLDWLAWNAVNKMGNVRGTRFTYLTIMTSSFAGSVTSQIYKNLGFEGPRPSAKFFIRSVRNNLFDYKNISIADVSLAI